MPTMPTVSAATGVSPPAAAANVVMEDIYGFLRVLADGTVLRSPEQPVFCAATFPSSHPSVQWKEAVYDKAKDLRIRMYKPSTTPSAAAAGGGESGKKSTKLPVLVHFHGGGFCLGSCTWANVHAFCLRLAADAGAVVLSAGYRLAPEHRLPTAVDDAVDFLRWLRAQSAVGTGDGWLTEAADFGRVFVTGDSAGGTIAHHLAVRAALGVGLDHRPVTVRGYVLLMPFFGGVRRTRSEAECPAEVLLNLDLFDRFWRLSLPAGATRDHPAANPIGPDSPDLGSVAFRAPVLVVVGGLDMMRDRTVDYAERLAAMGKPVELVEFDGKPHGFYLHEPASEATGELIGLVTRFLHSCDARLLD